MLLSFYISAQSIIRKKYFFILFLVCFIESVLAQDSSKSQTIQIVSSYKPVLKPGAKLSFSASPVPPAALTEKFSYILPDQQYKVLMKPVDLAPTPFVPDSLKLHNQHFLKVGYGNYNRIYADAGTSWGTGKPLQLQLFAGHHSQKGALRFQQTNRTYAQAHVQYYTGNNIFHLNSSAKQNIFYAYGNDALTANDKKDSLRLTYNQWSAELGLTQQTPNVYGITYMPSVKFQFLDAVGANEINALIRLPIAVKIKEQFSFCIGANADLTRFQIRGDTMYQNHIFSVTPSMVFPIKDFTFNLGTQFAWDNGILQILPQLGMEAFIKSNKAIIIAGVQSGITKNNFQSLIQQNPWIAPVRLQKNTRMDEYFAGLRGTMPFNLSYRITGGLVNFYHQPLFVNVAKTSLFNLLHESRLQAFNIKASAEWQHSDKISVDMGMALYQFVKQKDEKKAWHFIPAELHIGARWKPIKHLMLQSKIFAWDGPFVKTDNLGNAKKMPAVFDANIEADFRISKLFLIWLQMNNVFNQTYERWNQYPVLGFQLIGGIRLTFDQTK